MLFILHFDSIRDYLRCYGHFILVCKEKCIAVPLFLGNCLHTTYCLLGVHARIHTDTNIPLLNTIDSFNKTTSRAESQSDHLGRQAESLLIEQVLPAEL